MIKNHLRELIDIRLIVVIVVIIAIATLLTMLFTDKVKDFAQQYKKKFFVYLFSFVLIYALVAFLGYNKLFVELSDEFLFYQIASLLFGILHVYLYRWNFELFKLQVSSLQAVGYELLFALLITLYSCVLFIIIYTGLNGLALTFLMCSHFIVFIIPTGIYILFNYIMSIPPKEYVTWKIPSNAKDLYPSIESKEMIDLLLITLLIEKSEDSFEYSSIRAKAPVRIDFAKLFYHTTKNYNDRYSNDPIELTINNESCNWVFFLQPKWYQSARYVDAKYTLGMNGITENSVIICKRQKKEKYSLNKKKKNEDTEENLLLEENANLEKVIKKVK